jgi:GTPase SAR1 family protein
MNKLILDSFNQIIPDLKALSKELLVDIGDPGAILERARHKPRILILGEFNAGKSSLVNSALGEVLLPTGVTPTTSLITLLERGPLQINIKPIGQKDFVKIQPGKEIFQGFGIPEMGFDWDGFRKLLTDPKNIDQIEQIQFFHPAVPEGVVIVDTPGINDLSKARAELVYGLIPAADIVLFVISATKPFSESERVFLEERLLANDLKKIIFVLNRLDEIDEEEREELLAQTGQTILSAVNAGYTRVNAMMGQALYTPLSTVPLFGVSARDLAPIHSGPLNKGIGFELKGPKNTAGFSEKNRELWRAVLKLAIKDRETEVEALLHHFLRRGSMRLQRAFDTFTSSNTSNEAQLTARLQENGKKLVKVKGLLVSAEKKIRGTEDFLKKDIEAQVSKTFSELVSVFRLQRDPHTVNTRLKNLYEYMTSKLKSTLDQLYAELGKEFDTLLDDKKFVEEKTLSIQYDFSNAPQKIVSSIYMAYLAAMFFGGTVGMFAGVAYFASLVIANKKSVKEFLMGATVSEDALRNMQTEVLEKTNQEIEYAIDYVRQSIIQRIEVVQVENSHIAHSLSTKTTLNISSTEKTLQSIQKKINGFLVQKP